MARYAIKHSKQLQRTHNLLIILLQLGHNVNLHGRVREHNHLQNAICLRLLFDTVKSGKFNRARYSESFVSQIKVGKCIVPIRRRLSFFYPDTRQFQSPTVRTNGDCLRFLLPISLMKQHYYILVLLLIGIFFMTGCMSSNKGAWVESKGNSIRVWLSDVDSTLTYQWEGETFDSVAHGEGILRIISNDSVIDKKSVRAYYGALTETDIVNVDDKEDYVGELNGDDKLHGYGVYHKGDEIYIGHFKDSKPNGFLSWYKGGKPYYVGMWTDGKFHGEGTLYKEDGTIKSGEWENGNLTQTLVDVQLKNGHYNGYVKDNKPDGIGKMEYADGSVYSGKWKNGSWNGPGSYISSSDTISSVWVDGLLDDHTIITNKALSYEGGYMEGYPHGLCKIEIPNAYSFVGYMNDGAKSGYGELILSNGDIYKGDWENDLFDGDGIYIYSKEHAKYDGQWSQGLQDGIGYYQSPKFAFLGEWEEGWINGYGKMVFSNKDQYIGHFVENKFYGNGTYLFSNGNKYEGEFIEGKFNGLGSFYFAKGDTYIGEFKDGKIYGDGTLTIYENGKPITITANWPGDNSFPSKGSILFSNGDIYEGELINGVPTQNGKWTTETAIANNESWADKANEFYKNHKEEFDKISTTVTYVAIGVAVAATITSTTLAVISTGGAAAPAALVVTGNVLGTAATVLTYTNTTLYAGAIVASTASAVQDYRNSDDETEKSAIVRNTATNLAVDAMLLVAPKVAKSSAGRAAKVALSKTARTIGKKTMVTITKSMSFGKIITIVKGNNGIYEKRLVKSSRKVIKSTVEKGKQKFKSLLLERLIKRTKLYKNLKAIMAKGAITLSEKELKELLDNPKYIRAYIKTYAGDHKNFQEFFIRLAMGNKKQVKEILENPYIRKYIDRSIRQSGAGGVHEWLMTKNFKSFLTDNKWGDDGPFLALALTKLVQSTERVIFRNGGRHPSSIASNSSESAMFHQRLAKVIDSCSSKEELLIRVREFAKRELAPQAYEEFNEIFKTVFILDK